MQMNARGRWKHARLRAQGRRQDGEHWRGHLRNGYMVVHRPTNQLRRYHVQKWNVHDVAFCASEEMAEVMEDAENAYKPKAIKSKPAKIVAIRPIPIFESMSAAVEPCVEPEPSALLLSGFMNVPRFDNQFPDELAVPIPAPVPSNCELSALLIVPKGAAICDALSAD